MKLLKFYEGQTITSTETLGRFDAGTRFRVCTVGRNHISKRISGHVFLGYIQIAEASAFGDVFRRPKKIEKSIIEEDPVGMDFPFVCH